MAKDCGDVMTSNLVELTDASVTYKIRHGASNSLKETFIRKFRGETLDVEVNALRKVSISVNAGETLAIVGRNGAGKSTLLKLIARILPPTSGRVIVRGDVAPMLELGAGFNPELTGRENVVLYGTLLGREMQFMESRVDQISEWADLTDAIDLPIRTYSSGMLSKLAFSVATDVKSEVVLIDEILSIGDAKFQEKSKERMLEFFRGDSAIILVSHDLTAIRELATSAIWIDKGQVKESGDVDRVVSAYLNG